MKQEKAQLGDFMLIGLTARTNNKSEMNPQTSKIAALANYYWGNQLADNIKHRVAPGVTYAVYTEYASDEHGDYTYFIGEKVVSIAEQNLSQFRTLKIPESEYQKFTTAPGKMPDIVIASWQAIWKMNANDFDGQRKYLADFEVYDQRAHEPNNAIIDIYIGIK